MKVAVIGGKLQGIEATYLVKKAGWEVILFDKNKNVPAAGFADVFYNIDIISKDLEFQKHVKSVDFIISALEEKTVLDYLKSKADKYNIPILYDSKAYKLTSSKIMSRKLLEKLGISMPRSYPDCDIPIILKPSNASGSRGVKLIESKNTLLNELNKKNCELVAEEFLSGPIYSIEVVGIDGAYRGILPTKIEVDDTFDCKRVIGPSDLTDSLTHRFHQIGVNIAGAINLKGIMDVEAILHNEDLKVLEIDARLPSQTPITVYHSTGINLLKVLYEILKMRPKQIKTDVKTINTVIYEQIEVTEGVLKVLGEHIIGGAGLLKHYKDFFGADEALSNYIPGCSKWVAILIIKENNLKDAWKKHHTVMTNIKKHFNLTSIIDPNPEYMLKGIK